MNHLHSGNARAARRAQCKNKLSHAEHSCGSIAQCACNYFACVCGCNQTRPPSCRRRAHSPRTAQELPLSRSVANDKPPQPRAPPAFSKIKLGGVGPCSGYPLPWGGPFPHYLVSLCVAMIAITLLATQGHGFRCVSSFRQVSLAFGQPRVASPSRAQLPPASACVCLLPAPRLAVWVPAPASLSAWPAASEPTAAACPALGAFSSSTVAGRACVQAEAPRGLPYWHVPSIHNVPIVSVLAEAPRGLPYWLHLPCGVWQPLPPVR